MIIYQDSKGKYRAKMSDSEVVYLDNKYGFDTVISEVCDILTDANIKQATKDHYEKHKADYYEEPVEYTVHAKVMPFTQKAI